MSIDALPPLIGFEKPSIVRVNDLPAPAILRLLRDSSPVLAMPLHAGFRGGWPPITTLTFSNHTQSVPPGGTSISAPTGIDAGDLLIFHLRTSTNTNAVATGFTQATGVTNGARDGNISYKIADGTETTINWSFSTVAACLLFKPNRRIRKVTVNSPQAQATTANPTAQVIPATSAGVLRPVLSLGHLSAGSDIPSGTSFTGMTQPITSPSTVRIYAPYRIFNAADTLADSTVDMGDVGSNLVLSCYLTFS